MQRLVFVLVALCASLAGCRAARIRAEASPVLHCPEQEIGLDERQPGVFTATGCGRLAICHLPEENRAEVTCAGGAETRKPE